MKKYEISVRYWNTDIRTPAWWGCALRSEAGGVKVVRHWERFSFMSDDIEKHEDPTDADGFVGQLDVARGAIKSEGAFEVVIDHDLGAVPIVSVPLRYTKSGGLSEPDRCPSTAATFIVEYLKTGDMTSIEALKDYLQETFNKPIL